MPRELTYQLPFERLTRLGRAATRKAYPKLWWLTWIWIALTIAAFLAIAFYADTIEQRLDRLYSAGTYRAVCCDPPASFSSAHGC